MVLDIQLSYACVRNKLGEQREEVVDFSGEGTVARDTHSYSYHSHSTDHRHIQQPSFVFSSRSLPTGSPTQSMHWTAIPISSSDKRLEQRINRVHFFLGELDIGSCDILKCSFGRCRARDGDRLVEGKSDGFSFDGAVGSHLDNKETGHYVR
jgi:hypothetical protein